ncbi:MAG: hypothetical protein WC707_06880 [Candidatus Babeliaceae bacterium]|jgi:hypothetical protein
MEPTAIELKARAIRAKKYDEEKKYKNLVNTKFESLVLKFFISFTNKYVYARDLLRKSHIVFKIFPIAVNNCLPVTSVTKLKDLDNLQTEKCYLELTKVFHNNIGLERTETMLIGLFQNRMFEVLPSDYKSKQSMLYKALPDIVDELDLETEPKLEDYYANWGKEIKTLNEFILYVDKFLFN